jgi:signal transduction histidine kinase
MLAGLLVWALCGIDVVRTVVSSSSIWAPLPFVAWLLFLAAFLCEGVRPGRVDFRMALVVQSASALILIWWSGGDGIAGALLVMIAGQLPAVFSMRACLLWLMAQTTLAFLPRMETGRPLLVGVGALAYLAFELFAVGAAGLAESERIAREELAAAKGRLEVLQERLAETSREAERLRIARELHDSLGHHLTALGLDLELARHVATGEAVAPVERARGLASSLMSELRGAVTQLRADTGGDLVGRLRALVRSEGRPRVEVEVGPGVEGMAPEVALALGRVAQEMVTNATRHSGAGTLKLTLSATDSLWSLEGRDDGVGTDALRPGHGLSGMRERIEGVGGTLVIDTGVRRGFGISARVPRTPRT